MRWVFGAAMALLLFGGYATRPGGGLAGASSGPSASAQQVDAPPAAVVDALRSSMAADGLELVSRSETGDRYRLTVPAYAMAQNPEYAGLSRLGDLIVTARVHEGGAEVHTGFAMIDTGADCEIVVTPSADGQTTRVAIAAEVNEGTGRDARRVATALRQIVDNQAREILGRVVSRVGRTKAGS
jgi:hypothetical protein